MFAASLLIVLARTILGLFLSAGIGILVYIIANPVVLSIWSLSYISFPLLSVLSLGIGAGVGSYLAWTSRDLNLTGVALLAVGLAGGLGGAWGGLQRGIELDAYKLVGTPGIPALSVAIIGSVIGSNLPLSLIAITRAVRDPRI